MRAFTYDVCRQQPRRQQISLIKNRSLKQGSIFRGQLSGVKSKCYLNVILTIKLLHLIECCCSNTYKYKLLSGGQLSGVNCPGGKSTHPVEYF